MIDKSGTATKGKARIAPNYKARLETEENVVL